MAVSAWTRMGSVTIGVRFPPQGRSGLWQVGASDSHTQISIVTSGPSLEQAEMNALVAIQQERRKEMRLRKKNTGEA